MFAINLIYPDYCLEKAKGQFSDIWNVVGVTINTGMLAPRSVNIHLTSRTKTPQSLSFFCCGIPWGEKGKKCVMTVKSR